jgi:hypothetical protein
MRGKGTKWMVVVDCQEIPLACSTASASPPESNLVEGGLIQVPSPEERSIPLIADRAYESNSLREGLKQSKWDLFCPHRKRRKQAPNQDGRTHRRYRRGWTIKRTISHVCATLEDRSFDINSMSPRLMLSCTSRV